MPKTIDGKVHLLSSDFKPQSPDVTKYHAGPAGSVILPASKQFVHGGHYGLDLDNAAVVQIDPHTNPGLSVDLTKVTPDMMRNAMARGSDPLAVFKILAQQAPGGPDSRIGNFADGMPTTPSPQPVLQPAVAPQPQPQSEPQPEPPPPPQGPRLVTAHAEPPAPPPQPPAPSPPMPQPVMQPQPIATQLQPARRPIVPMLPEYQPSAAPPSTGAPFGLPFLAQPASLPSQKVIFQLGGMGTLSTAYHHVADFQGFLVLVFDNSCSQASQYMPPTSRQPFQVSVGGEPPITVVAPGLFFQLGHMDIYILMKVETAPEPQVEPQVETQVWPPTFISGNEPAGDIFTRLPPPTDPGTWVPPPG